MKIIEITMRIICFVIGVLLAVSTHIEVHDAGAIEVFANALYILIYLSAVIVLLVLPWALPLVNR